MLITFLYKLSDVLKFKTGEVLLKQDVIVKLYNLYMFGSELVLRKNMYKSDVTQKNSFMLHTVQ